MGDFRYHRVSSRFWTDEKTLRWNDDTRLLALYLMTCPHRRTEGIFRIPKPYIAADLGWSMERLAEPFTQLLQDGFIKYDESVSVLLFPNALRYQTPENKNQAVSAARAVAELPETPLVSEFIQLAERYSERLAKQLANVFAKQQTQTPTQTPTQDRQTAPARGPVLEPEPLPEPFASMSVSQSVGQSSEDELPEPHDDMTLSDVAQRYQHRIGILGPSIFDRMLWWHEEQGVSAGVLALAIDLTAEARAAGRCRSPDKYLDGILRNSVNEGIKSVSDWREKERDDASSSAGRPFGRGKVVTEEELMDALREAGAI